MSDTPPTGDNTHRVVLTLAAAATLLLVVMGGVVCVTDASMGCPDWPTCHGRLVPPAEAASVIEYTHRVLALLTAPLVLAAAIMGALRARSARWVRLPPLLAVGLFGVVATLGALTVLSGLSPLLAAVDLGSALAALGLVTAAAAAAEAGRRRGRAPRGFRLHGGLRPLAVVTLGLVFVVLVMGVLVAQPGSLARCLGWPLYGGEATAPTAPGLLRTTRLVLSVIAAGSVTALVAAVWRARPSAPLVRQATVAGLALAGELLLGATLAAGGATTSLAVAYALLAALLWVALTAMVVELTAFPADEPDPSRPGTEGSGRRRAASR